MKSGNNIRLLAAVGLSVMMSSAMADEPIKIGVPHAMTGAYAGDGESYFRGVEMAVTEINEAGGLLGRPVEMVTFDTQDFAPERMMEAADQLVANEGVVASHAGWAGWGQDVIAFGRYDAPFFMYNASELAIEEIRKNRQQHSNVFQLNDVERPMAEQVVDQMVALPWDYENETVAIITSDDSWGMEIGAGIRERAEELGWEVVIDETVPYGTREWRPILSRIRNEEPGWIHVEIVYTPDIVTFQRQFSSRPTRSLINYGYAGGSLPDFASEMGEAGEGAMGFTVGMPTPVGPTDEANAWIERFSERYGNSPPASAFAVYSGVMWWAEAVESAGDPTDYAAVNEYLQTTPYETLVGTIWRFNEDNHTLIEDTEQAHLQLQDGGMVTTHTPAGEPYLDFEWQVPAWIEE